MAIPEGKERITLTLPKELKVRFLEICEQEKRTPSKQFETILEKFVKDYAKE
ncbi:hypothetical protein [Clostridium sp. 001]|uniref:hypothetical protein n=1 Tax=Clostridium sp. 001 TaxID=1970093 RepID=UPI001C2BB666|nr:hypothetical protein [Clostridium sp. 001]